MAFTFRLRQSVAASTLVDFTTLGDYGIRNYGVSAMGSEYGQARITLDIRGTSSADLFDNFIALYRALEQAKRNWFAYEKGVYYDPIFLQFQDANASTLLQAECFGLEDDDGNKAFENILGVPQTLLAFHYDNVNLTLKIRGYFEETSAQALFSSTQSNAASTSAAGSASARGDLPMPLKIKVRTATTLQDTVIVAIRTQGTPSSYAAKYEAEAYNTRGSNVADRTDANFSGSGAPQGQRWTPAATTEQLLLRWRGAFSADTTGTFHVFVRCIDKKATANIRMRVRAGLGDGASSVPYQYGDWGDSLKYVLTPQGTTAVSLVDCGIISIPHIDAGASLPNFYVIELWGKAGSTGAGNELDIDYLLALPCYEGAVGGGFCIATFPNALGSSAAPDGVIDANDRVPDAYMEDTGVIQFIATDIKGNPLYGTPGASFEVWCAVLDSIHLRHTQNVTNTVTITGIPRYRVQRGT